MRRLHTVPITAVLVVGVAALNAAFLFSGGTRDRLDDPSAAPWAGLLLTYTLMSALTAPILTAVLASRQTDIEHTGAGWTLAGTAGVTPGSLCRSKFVALALVLLPAVVVQTLLTLAGGVLAGIRVPFEAGPWVAYTALLFLVDLAFCAFHIWIAALAENQLLSVGIGVLGAFVAGVSLLIPVTFSRLLPWGYYALISTVTQSSSNNIVYTTPPYPWIAGFLLLVGISFTVATRRLDHLER